MTTAGVTTSAAAPARPEARALADDHAHAGDPDGLSPPFVRHSHDEGGLAAIGNLNAVGSEKITRDAARPGRRAVRISVAQVSTARATAGHGAAQLDINAR